MIYLGTFSKILSPGVRLGWAVGPGPVLEKLNLGKQATDLCSSAFSQSFVAAFFAHGDWQGYVANARGPLPPPARRHARRAGRAPAARGRRTRPQGGLFVWATLPPELDTTDLLARALSRNVAFVPGRAAYRRRPRRRRDAR